MEQNQSTPEASRIWAAALVLIGSLMGTAGVAAGAMAAHQTGGGLLETASHYLLFHAAPVLAIGLNSYNRKICMTAASLLAFGAVLFSGDLALRALANLKPLAMAAPIGGLILILGWLSLATAGILDIVKAREAK